MSTLEGVAEEATIVDNRTKVKKRRLLMRILLRFVPKSPKSADGWANLMVWFATVAIPLWYTASYFIGPHNPEYPFMWAVPWIIAYPFWFAAQMLFLAISSQKTSEEIRYWEVFKAMAAPISSLVTIAIFTVLWAEHKYHFGGFQWNTAAAFFSATALNALIGGAVRFALKGRLFGQLNSSSDN